MSLDRLGLGGSRKAVRGGLAALGAWLLPLAMGCSDGRHEPAASSSPAEQRLDNAASIVERQVIAPEGATGFGQSMGISGNTVLVGASGAAYVLVQVGDAWQQEQKLSESEAGYGKKVAISGNTAAVAADGVVYVYLRTSGSWSEQQRLAISGVDFGRSVALSGDTLLVAAPGRQEGHPDGVAHVYVRSGSSWAQQGLLFPPSEQDGACFGCAVALEGDMAVVGMPFFGPSDMGKAFVFERSNGEWPYVQTLSGGTTGGNVGWALSIVDRVIYVGSPGHMPPEREEPLVGAVFVYVPTADGGWEERRSKWWLPMVYPSNPSGGMRFGEAIAASMDTLLVGAPAVNTAYVYTHANFEYSEAKQLTAATGFGSALVFTSSMALVGAPGDAGGSVTAFGQPKALVENGAACAAAGECASGHCVAGVCCASNCSDQGAPSCGRTGACDGSGKCALYAAGTRCADPACESEDMAVGPALCDGAGSCVEGEAHSCGEGHVCDAGACLKVCGDTVDCADGVCGGGSTCLLPAGSSCTAGRECESGHCIDGYCCNAGCGGNCESCAAEGSEGSCALVSTARDGSAVECGEFADGCTSDADCPDGSRCSEQVCLIEVPDDVGSGGSGEQGGSGAGTSGGSGGSNEHDDDRDDDGGCSVAMSQGDRGPSTLAIVLSALALLAVRRRVTARS